MKYNFDEIIDRSNTYSFKRDCLPEGAPKDSLSFWVADMDFPCADPVIEALHQKERQSFFLGCRYGFSLC